jgi:hypothetical protein
VFVQNPRFSEKDAGCEIIIENEYGWKNTARDRFDFTRKLPVWQPKPLDRFKDVPSDPDLDPLQFYLYLSQQGGDKQFKTVVFVSNDSHIVNNVVAWQLARKGIQTLPLADAFVHAETLRKSGVLGEHVGEYRLPLAA